MIKSYCVYKLPQKEKVTFRAGEAGGEEPVCLKDSQEAAVFWLEVNVTVMSTASDP